MRRLIVPLAVLGLLVAVEAAVLYVRAGRSAATPPESRLAEPFPLRPFAAADIDGRDVSVAAWRGRIVVVNFWATWCAPCRREIPALAALQDKYGDRLLVIGVLQDSVSAGQAREFAASVRMTYPLVPSTFEIEQSFPSVEALPMTFVIDGSARVVAVHAGEIDPAALDRELASLLRPQP